MRDIALIKETAKKEVEEDNFKTAKERYKKKLEELYTAEGIVKNLKRELEDLEDELSE